MQESFPSDPAAREEFRDTIVLRFGAAYENEHRGWWMDSADLLKVAREADDLGLDLLGSIHMHPDWHCIGPPSQRAQQFSERPTPMDRHLFGRTGWPLNLICYLERRGDAVYHALAAWAPQSPNGSDAAECAAAALRIRTSALVGGVSSVHEPDARAIRGLWDDMARGRARGDAAAFAEVLSEDCDFTTGRGERPAGRAGIETGHAALFQSPYTATVLDPRVTAIARCARTRPRSKRSPQSPLPTEHPLPPPTHWPSWNEPTETAG
ncbi:SgcJ/EcaC family oxidoreductase [Streptomyces umbrinus]|uniref:SgcJ/EcaC family oxidoreductase n=1 Tax=Streptomyces umbrinus TaxID=67370 RepID=UPI0033F7350C